MVENVNCNFNVLIPEKDPISRQYMTFKRKTWQAIKLKALTTKVNIRSLLLIACLRSYKKFNCMGVSPLSRLNWSRGSQTIMTESVSSSVCDLIYLTEQAILLMSQTSNTISYHHRLSTVSSSSPQANLCWRIKLLLSRLIWGDFRQHLMETVKLKKQATEVFIENMSDKHN